jgi:hypothetical protein
MKRFGSVALSALALLLFTAHARSDLQPVVGLHAFGGAERGHLRGVDDRSNGIGGAELFGLYPFTPTFGLQGSLLNQGGESGYRLGVSAGPVFAYGSGKVGMFGDYVYNRRDSLDFFYVRGQWAHYFQNFDLVFSYSHPVGSTQRRKVVDRRTVLDPLIDPDDPDLGTECGIGDQVQTRTRSASVPTINEFKSYVRIYPTQRTEVTLGFLVNSFAGPDRNRTGTGFGGVFGASLQLYDWLVFRALQGQIDTRERYRITSGLEFVWTPVKTDKPDRLRAEEEKDTSFAVASAATGISTTANALTDFG